MKKNFLTSMLCLMLLFTLTAPVVTSGEAAQKDASSEKALQTFGLFKESEYN